MTGIIMKEDHLKIIKQIKRKHRRIHMIGIFLLLVLIFVNWNYKMETNIVKESYKIFKSQFNSIVFKHQLYSLLRGKSLTINQAMDVAEVILNQEKVPISIALAMISVESDFNPEAVSKEGARGLTQIMPIVRKSYANHPSFKREISNVHEVSSNVRLGLVYLGDLQDKFKDWKFSLRAYNAGPENGSNKKYDGYANLVLNKAKEFRAKLEL